MFSATCDWFCTDGSQSDVKHASKGNKKKGDTQKRWLDNITDDMEEYNMKEAWRRIEQMQGQ